MTHAIGCRDAVERLWSYLDGELDEVDHEAVEAHLSYCLRCCGELAFSREVRQFLATRSGVDLPEDAEQRLEAFIERLDTGDSDVGAPR